MAQPILLRDLLNHIQQSTTNPIPANRIDPARELPLPDAEGRTRKSGPWRSGVYAPIPVDLIPVSRDAAQARAMERIYAYLKEKHPEKMLLLRMPAGSGKTYMMVKLAEQLANEGHRVFYAGPRRNFFNDLISESRKQDGNPHLWYNWQPRQGEESECPNCLYPAQIHEWISRGNKAINFCQQSCGFPYIKDECVYYAQKNVPHRIIYGTHPHVFVGNPMFTEARFDLLIGDEEPITESAVLRSWEIPLSGFMPYDLRINDDHLLRPLVERLQGAAAQEEIFHSGELLNRLGGAEYVRDVAAEWIEKKALAELQGVETDFPRFHHPDNAEYVTDYNYLSELIPLLHREAVEELAGREYLHRVVTKPVGRGRGLVMFLRRYPHPNLPQHVIWLDATGRASLYEAAFQRPVEEVRFALARKGRLIQVASRSNSKSTFEREEGHSKTLQQAVQQMERIVRDHGYQNVGVVTYKGVRDRFEEQGARLLHFGGNRGSNELVQEDAMGPIDALFVIGTPMPQLYDIVNVGKMLWQQRMTPFDTTWSERPHRFTGTDYVYFKSGLWDDPDLNEILWLKRDAEIIQSVYRGRFLTRPTDVYLMSSLPIDELPPDEIWSIRKDIFTSPEGVNPYNWNDCLRVADMYCSEYGQLTVQNLCDELEVDDKTARKYMDLLIEGHGYTRAKSALAMGRGRKPDVLLRIPTSLETPPTVDRATWAQVMFQAEKAAASSGLSVRQIRELFGCTMDQARQWQELLIRYGNFTRVGATGRIIR